MPDEVLNLDFGADGSVTSVYDDKLNKLTEDLGWDMAQVCRLSNVEWEEVEGKKGWTVRAAHDKDLAIRINSHDGFGGEMIPFTYVCARYDSGFRIAVFESREEALAVEKEHYDDLMPPKEGR